VNYLNEPLSRYLDDAAAGRPTPGGGSVAAVAAALASTMASMAAAFTAGKEKFRPVEGEIQAALARLAQARSGLMTLAHEDMAAYDAIMAAMRMPKATDAEKLARGQAMTGATRRSLEIVEQVMAGAADVVEVSRRLADIANPNLLSDVGVAAELGLGAVRAARINAAVNLTGYADAVHAAAVRQRVDAAVAAAERLAAEVREIVMKRLM
jgi:formiminotetrahydrofolate cyclodeaminase